ncbi:MAG: 4-(cytidine 5'-diphospho)-2-C-methyl-D-erythritol kinase [Clostridia bacterium]
MLKVKCPAKINLTLDVLGLTEKNYHKVEMIMQTVSLYDEITAEKSDKSGIFLKTNLPYVPCDIRNSAYKAAKYFYEYTNFEPAIRISMHKKIPVSAGLAGGSTNAAGVLLALNKLYETNLTNKELLSLCGKIGADVSFCLRGGTVLASGIGEVLTPIKPLMNCYIVLAKPTVPLSTQKVYKQLDSFEILKHPDTKEMIRCIESNDLKGICNNLYNVMEVASVALCPKIANYKDIMNSAHPLGCVMSGSGPTVFAIFDDEEDARRLCMTMKDFTKDAFVASPCSGPLLVNC